MRVPLLPKFIRFWFAWGFWLWCWWELSWLAILWEWGWGWRLNWFSSRLFGFWWAETVLLMRVGVRPFTFMVWGCWGVFHGMLLGAVLWVSIPFLLYSWYVWLGPCPTALGDSFSYYLSIFSSLKSFFSSSSKLMIFLDLGLFNPLITLGSCFNKGLSVWVRRRLLLEFLSDFLVPLRFKILGRTYLRGEKSRGFWAFFLFSWFPPELSMIIEIPIFKTDDATLNNSNEDIVVVHN